MTFTQNHIQTLLQLVQNTRDVELNCDECIAQAAEYAETQLAGLPLNEQLAAVEQHFSVCGECREELEALLRSLEAE